MRKKIVIVSCHFASRNAPCLTTHERIRSAKIQASLTQDNDKVGFVATGNVPYDRMSRTLAQLILEELASEPYPKEIAEGVGIFSEARFVVESATKEGDVSLTIVSSDWYFWAGRIVWEEFAAANNVPIDFVRVRGTGGLHTKIFYAGYGSIVHIAYLMGCEKMLEKFMTMLQLKRKEGFTMDGCA